MKNISTVRFDNLTDMITGLRCLDGDAIAMQDGLTTPVYVVGPDGTHFGRAVLKQEKLTDGSVVHYVALAE